MTRGVVVIPEVTYHEAETLLEHEHALDAAFDVLFNEVLRRRVELSTETLPKCPTSVYN